MHPHDTARALHKELERNPERRAEIEAELAFVESLPIPVTTPEDTEVLRDHTEETLKALATERRRAANDPDRVKAIDAETKALRVKARVSQARNDPRDAVGVVSTATNDPVA